MTLCVYQLTEAVRV